VGYGVKFLRVGETERRSFLLLVFLVTFFIGTLFFCAFERRFDGLAGYTVAVSVDLFRIFVHRKTAAVRYGQIFSLNVL